MPANEYLDASGLSYFYNKLKNALVLEGDVTGSVGNNSGLTISTSRRECSFYIDNSTITKPWCKVASYQVSDVNKNFRISFAVENTFIYPAKAFGILSANVRADGTGAAQLVSFHWLSMYGFDPDDFIIAVPSGAFPLLEIWTRLGTAWAGRCFTVLSEGLIDHSAALWTLHPFTGTDGQQASAPSGTASSLLGTAFSAVSASKLGTARTIAISGGATGTATAFDGSGNITIPVTALDVSTVSAGVLAVANGGTGSSTKNFVDLSTNQVVGGNKEYTGTFTIKRNWANITAQNNHVDFTDTSANSQWAGFWHITDKNGVRGMTTSAWSYPNGTIVNARLVAVSDNQTVNMGTMWFSYPTATGGGAFVPYTDDVMKLGVWNLRWNAVFASSGTINTSDERIKTSVRDLPDEVLDAWESVPWCQFQMVDSVNRKGPDGARIHSGLVAQRVDEAFRAHGLDASRYGLFCHDEWDATGPVYGENGEVVVPARDAGDLYSLRYDEALSVEAAYLRRENERLKKRVADLEERLAALELKIS